MRIIILFSLLISFIFGQKFDYYGSILENIESKIGKEEYQKEISLVAKEDLDEIKKSLSKRINKKLDDKKQYSQIDVILVFDTLTSAMKKTNSSIPSLFAYNLMLISVQNKNLGFNTLYGENFSQNLIEKNKCEGYLWKGLIDSEEKSKWKSAHANYKLAKEICTNEKDKGTAARMEMKYRYLSTPQKKENKQ